MNPPRSKPQIQLPFRALQDWLRRNHGCESIRQIGELVATDRSADRWRARGGIPLASAYALADELGVHPVEIWGDDVIALPERSTDVIGWHLNRLAIRLADQRAAIERHHTRKAALR